ncbi:MAG: hypothetical protein KAU62_16190, partial [Candidatus Heimdallarchaeota archaeon]|nr:hypothetical protein [Candidatus Heimdallarchaeota archaeon]
LLDEIIQSFKAKHLFVVNSITDTNLMKLVDIASEDFEVYSYYWLKRAGITSKIQKFDLTPQVYEPYMKTWRKLHFDLDTDSRVKMYNNIKNLDGVTDVRIITGNEALEELMSHPDINLRIINKNNGIDDIAIIHWVDAEGEPHFVSLVDTYKGGAKGNPLSSHKKHIYDNTIDGVDQAGRKYYEKATEVRQEFLKENLLKQEYEVLIKWRQDSQMLDELIYYRTTHCLDSRATDGIAKIGIPVGYTGGGGSNFLFLTTYHTVYGSDHYVQRAIIELFDNNIANWNEDLYKAFVHAETEKIMLGYVKELQMEELVLTGRMTEVGEILDDGTIKYFDEKGRLLLRTDNRQVLTIEEMAVRFINPADGGKTSSLLIDQQFLQPQIRNMGIWDGQEWITRPRVAWNDLPTEISDISWLEIKIEEIQQQIGKELGFDNYHFEYQIVSLDLIERIQREAAAMFQERLIKEGLIEGIYSSGTSSGWQVTVIGLSNDLHPAQITRWIEESSWYYGMKNYENIIFIEDGVKSETVFKQGTDSGHGLVSLTRGEREIFLENLPFRVTSAWCAGLDPHAYKRELQSAIYHFQDSYKLHTNAIAAGNKALAKEYKNTCELIIERIYELEGIIKIRISYTRKASLAPIHKWKEWIDDYITSSGLKPKKAISTSNYNSYQQDSYSNITNSRFNSIISFMDKEGKYIEINGERVNIQFNWRDLFEKTSNPLYKYGGNIGLYLLLPPGETYTSSSNTLFDWDSIEDSTGAIDNDVLQDFRNTEDIWSIDNIHMETEMFKQDKHIDSYRQKQAWVNYLIQKGYSTEIIDWVKGKNHKYHPLQPDSNSKTATLAISAITHEYMSILREFKVWIVRLLFLRDSVFKIWEESSLTLEDVWGNFKFKTNGIIKAWHDNAELTYDGLKKKEIVSITFIDFMSYEYLNGTEDWTYISEPYVFGGYNSGIEQYVNTLTQQGMKWMMINSDNTAKILKLCRWLTKNIFSIAGVL